MGSKIVVLSLIFFLLSGCGSGVVGSDEGNQPSNSVQTWSPDRLLISEASSINSSFEDEDGDTPDWIELFNGTGQDIDLNGWSLSDDNDDLGKWSIGNVSIAAGEHLLIWASGKDRLGHSNFKLSSKGETVSLSHQAGEVVDSLAVEGLVNDTSIGRSTKNGEVVYFDEPTPGARNASEEFKGILDSEISFSHDGGEFDDYYLALEGASDGQEIRITFDASIPNVNSPLYSAPLTINSNVVLRARVFSPDFIPSKVFSRTYIKEKEHDLPIVTLVTAPENFFDSDTGIYVFGPEESYDSEFPFDGANFWKDWERDIHFTFYEPNGDLGITFDGGVKIFGGSSRVWAQKSMSIFARSRYGTDEIDYPLFPSLSYDSFQAIVLRNSGNDWLRANMRDVVSATLMQGSGMEYQAHRPVAVYLNGEYWGFYNIREKVNEHFLDSKIDVAKKEINLLEGNGEVVIGSNEEYLDIIRFLDSNDMWKNENYEYIASKIDIDNLIAYQVAQIYFDNRDWPGNNIKYWSSPTTKWRWVLFDTDFGWGLKDASHYEVESLSYALGEPVQAETNNLAPPWSTKLLQKLIENYDFRNKFINRFSDEFNHRFSEDNVVERIDSIASNFAPEMENHFERWGDDYESNLFNVGEIIPWSERVDVLRQFGRNRISYLVNDIVDTFQLTGTYKLEVNSSDDNHGRVAVNDIIIQSSGWVGTYFHNVPVSVTALPREGYEFSHWEGSLQGVEDSLILEASDDASLLAVFKVIDG
jgi:hypothetical protein